MRGKHRPELCNPIILLIHLCPPFSLLRVDFPFFLSITLPQTVVKKLVGFGGFEVEDGEKKHVCVFFPGSLQQGEIQIVSFVNEKRGNTQGEVLD